MLAMENMDASSPAAKIVGEELHAFFERARKRLNEIGEEVSLEESNKEIRRLVAFRLGFPTAKTVTGKKRSPSTWNGYQSDNYKRVKLESGIFSLSFDGFFSLSRLGKSKHKEVIKTLSEEYHSRPPQEQNKTTSSTPSGSTTPSTSSGSTTPSTSSALGDALLPPQGAKWAAERRTLWNQIKTIVLFMSLPMLTL
jgi:hypothetical protein